MPVLSTSRVEMYPILTLLLLLSLLGDCVQGQTSGADIVAEEGDSVLFNFSLPQSLALDFRALVIFHSTRDIQDGMYIWVSNNTLHPNSPNFHGQATYQGNVSARQIAFTLRNVTSARAGLYRCGRNSLASSIPNCGQMLVVQGPPTMPSVTSSSPGKVVEGRDVTLTCSSNATTLPASERLPLSYSWFRGGNPVSGGTNGTLVISPVRRADERNYTCRSREGDRMTSEFSPPLFLDVAYGPGVVTLLPPDPQHEVRETTGAVPEIRCQADCDPPCSFRWTDKGGNPVGPAGSLLQLTSISRTQAGNFSCTASNQHGAQTATTFIEVMYGPSVTSLTLNSRRENATVGEGVTWTLACVVSSNPRSLVRLLNVSSSSSSSSPQQEEVLVEQQQTDRGLAVEGSWPAQCLHTGNYSCSATNSVGSVISPSPVQLFVTCSPRQDLRVHGVQTTLTSGLGGNVTFTLPLVAFPSPQHLWYRQDNNDSGDGESILGAGASSSGLTASLTLTSVRQRDFGLYFLNVSNQAGAAVFSFELRRGGPPECPRLLSVSWDSSTSALSVSWERGSNNGGEQRFLVEVREGAGQWRNSSPQVRESALQDRYSLSLDSSSLQPGTRDLALRVRAYNQFGASCPSSQLRLLLPLQGVQTCPQVTGAGVGVGLVLGLAVAALAVGLFCLVRWRQGRQLHKAGSHTTCGHGVIHANDEEQRGGGEEASRHYAGLDVITRHQPREEQGYEQLSPRDAAREAARPAGDDSHVYENPTSV